MPNSFSTDCGSRLRRSLKSLSVDARLRSSSQAEDVLIPVPNVGYGSPSHCTNFHRLFSTPRHAARGGAFEEAIAAHQDAAAISRRPATGPCPLTSARRSAAVASKEVDATVECGCEPQAVELGGTAAGRRAAVTGSTEGAAAGPAAIM